MPRSRGENRKRFAFITMMPVILPSIAESFFLEFLQKNFVFNLPGYVAQGCTHLQVQWNGISCSE